MFCHWFELEKSNENVIQQIYWIYSLHAFKTRLFPYLPGYYQETPISAKGEAEVRNGLRDDK
jgi:hypothetical protein